MRSVFYHSHAFSTFTKLKASLDTDDYVVDQGSKGLSAFLVL